MTLHMSHVFMHAIFFKETETLQCKQITTKWNANFKNYTHLKRKLFNWCKVLHYAYFKKFSFFNAC